MENWWKQLRWSATGYVWFAQTEELCIFVSEKTYEHQVKAYFEGQGMQRKTYAEIMKPAEEEWKRQCEAEQALQANLDYWLACKAPGIEVSRREEISQVKRR